MKRINVMEEILEVVEFMGQQALFTNFRVDKATVPEGTYCYELRHGDEDDRTPATVEKKVTVNYFGAVILTRELSFKEDFLSLTPDDFGFSGERMTIQQFLQVPRPFEDGSALAAYLMLTFYMSIKEADTLLWYLTEHDYAVGHKDSEGFFLRDHDGEWKEYSIDDLIDMVCDWNYELIQSTESDLETCESETDEAQEYYHKLLEDAKLLDGLFDRTKYGGETEKLAREIAMDLVNHFKQPEELSNAEKRAVEKIKKFLHKEAKG